jgi:hypothetical protein
MHAKSKAYIQIDAQEAQKPESSSQALEQDD